jgi:hypothetical protein
MMSGRILQNPMSNFLVSDQIPIWLKISYTVFVAVLVPVYWQNYGPGNFLWFSDIALLTTTAALWLESPLLASTMTLSVVLLELVWNFDFFLRLISGASTIGLSSYMFDPKISLALRALSLFHVVLPTLLLWLVYKLGYDARALGLQTIIAWVVLVSSYCLTASSENVNWVRGLGKTPQIWMPAPLYLALMMILFPLVIYFPTHLLLRKLFD